MLRKLVILGSIAALFVLAAAPAFGLSVNTGPGHGDDTQTPKEVLSVGDASAGESNPAHGPLCGVTGGPADCPNGVQKDNPGKPGAGPIPHPTNLLGVNTGAWNAVFGPGGMSNDNSAICGIVNTDPPGDFDPENNCDV